ncbi:hypothetical protein [Pseudomonas savastanoi]|uniref:hypothetical protein n=1 Tax=Pseudomonas savastanoi TaxID=29438 RepID=UPI0013C2A155|nr:hypothetical protein [Pseudomonas savastanoi]
MNNTAQKTSRSERQAGKPVAPVAEQRLRILTALTRAARGSLPMSALAYAAFPNYEFRTPQGAALAVSRTVRGLEDEKLLIVATYGFQITTAGRAVIAAQDSAVQVILE